MEKLLELGSNPGLQSKEELQNLADIEGCMMTPLVAAFHREKKSKACVMPGSLKNVVERLEKKSAKLDSSCAGWELRSVRQRIEGEAVRKPA